MPTECSLPADMPEDSRSFEALAQCSVACTEQQSTRYLACSRRSLARTVAAEFTIEVSLQHDANAVYYARVANAKQGKFLPSIAGALQSSPCACKHVHPTGSDACNKG